MLEYIIPSNIRRKILVLFLKHSDERFYLRQVAYQLQEGVSAVQRELSNLEGCGFLMSTRVGNLRFYFVNSKCALSTELRALFQKDEQIQKIYYTSETVIDWKKHRQRLSLLKEKEIKYNVSSEPLSRKKPRSAIEQKMFEEIKKRKG